MRTPILILVLALLSALTHAQGTRADYERADALPGDWGSLVRNAEVRVRWLTPSYPVYQYDLPDGSSEWRTIDLETGAISPALDMDRIGAQLSELGVEDSPRVTWFDAIQPEVEPLTIVFTLAGHGGLWSVHADASNLRELSPEDFPEQLGLKRANTDRSRGGGPRTSVFVLNAHDEPVEFQWLDSSGTSHTYATLEPGQSHRQGTYTNHAWRVITASGKTLGVYLATEDPGVIIATEPPKPEPIEDRRGKGRQPWPGVDSPSGSYTVSFPRGRLTIRNNNSGRATKPAEPLEEPFEYEGVHWSPDSTKFVTMRVERAPRRQVHIVESTPDDRTPDELQPELVTFDYVKPGDPIDQPKPALFVADSLFKEIEIDNTPIGDTWSVNRIEWAPDSSAFYYLYNERGHQTLRVVRVDASTGESRVIIEETSDTFINYSNKTYLNILHDRNEIIWMSERSGWNHLYRFDATTGELLNPITEGEWVVRSVDHFNPDTGVLRLRIMGYHKDQDPYHIHFARVNIDGTGFTLLTEGDGTHDIEFSPDGAFYTDRYSRIDMPPVVELRRTSDAAKVATLAEADWSELISAGWNPPERFVAKGRDGETDIWGFIQKPTNFDPSTSYPVIESIYAGPHGQHVPKSFSVWRGSRSIAELGFITVHIDGMGTNWRSKAFHDVAWKNIKDAGFPDRIAWMKAAAETRPYMDIERVGIYGVSAGGQNAMATLLWHNDFYDAAVADCGCHDNRMDKIWWNEAWMGYPIDEAYSKSSNRDNAHLLEGDLLITVGELDRNVDPASTTQVVDALIRADKDFEFINFPGLGHGTIGSPYGQRRMRDFFVRSLWGVEPRRE
ncbi:MAG: prolyl oligopeptidase family serine peptidase [Phycisphaerales bacterium]|nr:prolyl oligopeptidase family serine peptidase [Phycisphaerales bacterium]